MKSMVAWALLVVLAGLLSGCALIANRFHVPAAQESAKVTHRLTSRSASPDRALRIVTWNIGYAGMGAEADFVADGGLQKRPESRHLVKRNLQAITETMRELDGDVYLLQEVARRSWNTYQVDTLDPIQSALPGYDQMFAPDLKTRWVPEPLHISLGNAILSRITIGEGERRGLPLEPEFVGGVFRKGYRMHIARLPIQGTERGWVLVNIHFAAFDEEAKVRREQLDAVVRFATGEYSKGNHVVIGGDWNFRLADRLWPHATAEEHLFWVRDLPDDAVPPGWNWAVDPNVPTVRTAHQPYLPGDNYVLVIDGFLCSPNVRIESVQARNLGFVNTDHHPVVVRVSPES